MCNYSSTYALNNNLLNKFESLVIIPVSTHVKWKIKNTNFHVWQEKLKAMFSRNK